MDDVRKRIFNELVFAPSVILPGVVGASAWLISWGAGGLGAMNLVGLVGVLGAVGWFATRAIFQMESIAAKVMRAEATKLKRAEEEKLDDLRQRLRVDRDPRTKDYLTLLRTSRDEFEEIAKEPGIALRSMDVIKQMQQLFRSAIDQLEYSLKLHELAERLNDGQRDRVIHQREEVLTEIRDSVEHMQSAVKHYRDLIDREQHTDLNTLQDELDASIRIAKRTEERMKELDSTPDYDSFLKQ